LNQVLLLLLNIISNNFSDCIWNDNSAYYNLAEPEWVTQTLAFSLRQRTDCAGVWGTLALGKEPKWVTRRWRFHYASVLIATAYEGRWRWEGSQNGLPRRWRFHCAGV
jgi:hypothetical protein